MFGTVRKTAIAARGVPWLLLALAAAGCGRTGQVAGKVSYRGQPLPDGTVMLLASDGRAYDGPIQSDGAFQLPNVPAGVAKVCITSMALPGPGEKTGRLPEDGRAKRRIADKGVARSRIPTKYSDFDQSGLTVTVEKGATARLDLNLK
jgi:hypothetical protein